MTIAFELPAGVTLNPDIAVCNVAVEALPVQLDTGIGTHVTIAGNCHNVQYAMAMAVGLESFRIDGSADAEGNACGCDRR